MHFKIALIYFSLLLIIEMRPLGAAHILGFLVCVFLFFFQGLEVGG